MKSEKEHGLKPIVGKPKVVHGGRFFTNPNREPKPREVNPLEQGFSMGASRGFTLCETFKDWDDCSSKFYEITCPKCMESDIYRKWLRALTILRLTIGRSIDGKYGWDYKLLLGVKIDMYMNQDWREKQGDLIYE